MITKITLEEKKLHNLVRGQVIEVLREFFNDPDFGLELKPEFEARLKKSIKSKTAGRTTSLARILEKYKVR